MAPRSSKQASNAAGSLAAAFKKLCEELHGKPRQNGSIQISTDTLNSIQHALRSSRLSDTLIQSSFIIDILECLENGDTCHRLDSMTMNTILQTILQVTYSRGAERCMYLIGAALTYDSHLTTKKRDMEKKKTEIGKDCSDLLLTYFTDGSKNDGMRRWVGILYLQLFKGSDKNREKLELCSEATRRQLGSMVLEESNEIIRIICGQLITAMLDVGIDREHLWPTTVNKELYASFPDSSQGERGWNGRFQAYMDSVWDVMDPPDLIGSLYFAQNVSITPPRGFGVAGHNVNIVIEMGQMIFFAPTSVDANCFAQSLEVPLRSIKQMIIETRAESQLGTDIANVYLELENYEALFCHLDSAPTILTRIFMILQIHTAHEIKIELSRVCEDVEVIEKSQGVFDGASGQSSHNQMSKLGARSSTADAIVVWHDEQARFEPNVRKSHQVISEVQGTPTSTITQLQQGGDSTLEQKDSVQNQEKADNLYAANPWKARSEKVPHLPANERTSTKPNTKAQKNTTTTKLTAKQSRLMSQRFTNDNEEISPISVIRSATQAQGRAEEAKADLSDQKLQLQIRELQLIFPFEDTARLRGALVACFGSREDAIKNLRRTIPTQVYVPKERMPHITEPHITESHITEPQITEVIAGTRQVQGQNNSEPKNLAMKIPQASKANGNFGSDSLTSVDPNDASTPKIKAAEGKFARTSITATVSRSNMNMKQPAMRKQPNEGIAAAEPKQAKYALKPKTSLRVAKFKIPSSSGKEREDVVNRDPYDISEDEEGNEPSMASRKPRKSAARAIRKTPISVSKTTCRNTIRSGNVDAKKRKSAPAAIETTAAATRSKRSAVSGGGRISRKENTGDNQTGESEVDISESQMLQRAGRGTRSTGRHGYRPVSKLKLHIDTELPAISQDTGEDLFNLQQGDAVLLGLVANNLVNPLPDSDEDLYGASPKKPVQKPQLQIDAKHDRSSSAQSKRDSSSLKDFTSKLDNILGDIDDGPVQADDQICTPRNASQKSSLSCGSNDPQKLRGSIIPEEQSRDHKNPKSNNSARLINVSCLNLDSGVRHKTSKEENLAEISTMGSSDKAGKQDSATVGNDKAEDATVNVTKSNNNQPTENTQGIAKDQSAVGNLANNDGHPGTLQIKAVDHIQDDRPGDHSNDCVLVMRMNEHQGVASPGKGKKRKAPSEVITLPKRRQTDADGNQPNVQSPLRRSPDIKLQDSQNKEADGYGKTNSKPFTPPSGRSPRLDARAQHASEALNSILSKKLLLDERLSRKVPIVAFNAKGAMNQGPSSVLKGSSNFIQVARPAEKSATVANVHVDHKRKRGKVGLEELQGQRESGSSPPKKRKSVSPIQNRKVPEAYDYDDLQYLSSPPAPRLVRGPISKPSSQASRVDENGSPLALTSAARVDHISKIKRKLQGYPAELTAKKQASEDSYELPCLRNSPDIFGPKVRLDSITKTRPSSPREVAGRYVKHKKTPNGSYEAVDTKEVVAPKSYLADPFVERQVQRSNGFAEHVQVSNSKGNNKADFNSHPTKKGVQRPLGDKARALMDSQALSDISSPPDLTSGTTSESRESKHSGCSLSEGKGRELNDAWNLALRPHYASLSDAIRRVTDEVIIRLAKEEDVMGLLVNQYRENGKKLVNEMADKRNMEKKRILFRLDQKKKEMMTVYANAKEFVGGTEMGIKSSSLPLFEQQWRKDQEVIQKLIKDGRRILDQE